MSSVMEGKSGPEHGDRALTEENLSVLVYIRSYRDRVPEGTFITLPDREEYAFCGLDQMLLIMEDIMDGSLPPENAPEHRYLRRTPFIFRRTGYRETGQTPVSVVRLSGEKITFSIQVSFRRNRSMQGRLTACGNRKQTSVCFRSSLELIRMLHEHLSLTMREWEERTGS